jgi:hypothetical protein
MDDTLSDRSLVHSPSLFITCQDGQHRLQSGVILALTQDRVLMQAPKCFAEAANKILDMEPIRGRDVFRYFWCRNSLLRSYHSVENHAAVCLHPRFSCTWDLWE